MQGATGPGGVNSIIMQDWLFHCGKDSCKLQESVATVACWLAITCSAWAAYHVMVAVRLIALDRCLGVHPVRVGELLPQML
eukprot:2799743-Ditylum_brightwellii.AAC.1